MKLADPLDDEGRFELRRRERARDRLRAFRLRCSQDLLGPAQPRHEPVRELEDFGRRAIVVLEADHLGVRKPRGHCEQVLRARAREGVDRLVVVADGAQLVAIAEPAVEERLLEQVDVLVLVDGEGLVALANLRQRALVRVEEPDRELDQVLEVDAALVGLAPLVLAVDAEHEVRRDRRLVVAERAQVLGRSDAPVLRPLDLGREVGGRAEAVGPSQRVPDVAERERLRREDLPGRLGREEPQLTERGRMEGRAPHARHAELLEPAAHLAGRLVGERDREDLVGAKGAGRNLVRDPVRDRRRLPGAGPGEDANRPADGLDRAALLRSSALLDTRPTATQRASRLALSCREQCQQGVNCEPRSIRSPSPLSQV